jgi:hypothetical protein
MTSARRSPSAIRLPVSRPSVKWHGQDLPATREIVKIAGVETAVDVPEFDEPELRQLVAMLTAVDRFENAADITSDHILEITASLFERHGGTVATWRKYETMLGIPRSRTKQPKSPLQPFLRWGRGGNPDTTGRLSELSATLDDRTARKNPRGTGKTFWHDEDWGRCEASLSSGNLDLSAAAFAINVVPHKTRASETVTGSSLCRPIE